MIRGYVTLVSSDLPWSRVPPVTPDLYRKAAIRLVHNEDTREFYINVEGTDYSFKVVGNVRRLDRRNIARSLVRIGFILPHLDVVISSNPVADLEAFVRALEVVNDIRVLPPKCNCEGPNLSHYHLCHTPDCNKRPLCISSEALCESCCYRVLEFYNDDDATKIINSWKSRLRVVDRHVGEHVINSITAISYPYLRSIDAYSLDLQEIPRALGSLPCLTSLRLSRNRLGKATNWNWLTSLFIRENLRELCLDHNGLCSLPEPVLRLKTLETLSLFGNSLTELPSALRNLWRLRSLDIGKNKLVILPASMYRMERLYWLRTTQNDFHCADDVYNSPRQLDRKDFATVTVPSLFEAAASRVISERLAFWEYDVPSAVSNYLESSYCCRCGKAVLPNATRQVVQCRIKTEALAELCTGNLATPIDIRCCSYECYKLMEPYIM